MKKSTLLWGALCSFAFFSCQKNMKDVDKNDTLRTTAARGHNPNIETNFFDVLHLISPSAQGKLDTLGSGFGFTEGPAVDRHGNIFFTDQPNDKIYKWEAATGKISLFLHGTGRSNGMAFDRDGNLIACADMNGELWKIYPDGSHEVLVDNYNGKKLNGPNDVWINPVTGGIYITDPLFGREYWSNDDPRKGGPVLRWPGVSQQAKTPGSRGGYVYYLAPGSKTLVRVTTEEMGWSAEGWPNGIVGTPDGKKLYINKWGFNRNTSGTWVFDVNPNGTLSNMQKFVDMGGDGMSMDELGNVYISNDFGVTAFSPNRQKVLNIPTGPSGATNNVFGGPNNKILFITGPVDKLTSVRMNVKGVEKFKP